MLLGRVIGTVVNKLPATRGQYGYHGYGHYADSSAPNGEPAAPAQVEVEPARDGR